MWAARITWLWKRIPSSASCTWATKRLVRYLSLNILKGFDKIVTISGSSGSVQDSVSASGGVDFFRDDFFSSCIEGSIRRGTVREPRSVVCSCFGGETGWFGYFAALGTLSLTLIILARAGTWMLRNSLISLKPASTSSSSSPSSSLDRLSSMIIPPPLTSIPTTSLLSCAVSQLIGFFYLKTTSYNEVFKELYNWAFIWFAISVRAKCYCGDPLSVIHLITLSSITPLACSTSPWTLRAYKRLLISLILY
jgi:hypothetical protein